MRLLVATVLFVCSASFASPGIYELQTTPKTYMYSYEVKKVRLVPRVDADSATLSLPVKVAGKQVGTAEIVGTLSTPNTIVTLEPDEVEGRTFAYDAINMVNARAEVKAKLQKFCYQPIDQSSGTMIFRSNSPELELTTNVAPDYYQQGNTPKAVEYQILDWKGFVAVNESISCE